MKINAMIVGAQKAGTTALLKHLGKHKDISIPNEIEFTGFMDWITLEDSIKESFEPNKVLLGKQVLIYTEANLVDNLFRHNQDMKVIFIERNPVDRFISAWNMSLFDGWNNLDINSYLVCNTLQNAVDRKSFDVPQVAIKQCLKFGDYHRFYNFMFNRGYEENLLVLQFDDLINNPQSVVDKVCSFIGVDYFELPFKPENTTRQSKKGLITFLVSLLRSDKFYIKTVLKWLIGQKLFSKLGYRFIQSSKSKKAFPKPDKRVVELLEKYYGNYIPL